MYNKKKIKKVKFFKSILLISCITLLSSNLNNISTYAYENQIDYYGYKFESIEMEIINLESQ